MAAASASVTTYMDERVARRVVGGKRLDLPELREFRRFPVRPRHSLGHRTGQPSCWQKPYFHHFRWVNGPSIRPPRAGRSWTVQFSNLLANKT